MLDLHGTPSVLQNVLHYKQEDLYFVSDPTAKSSIMFVEVV